jgi:hypothetical protein
MKIKPVLRHSSTGWDAINKKGGTTMSAGVRRDRPTRQRKAAGHSGAGHNECPFPECNLDHAQMQADVETCEALLKHRTCSECNKGDQLCPTAQKLFERVEQMEARDKRGWRKQPSKEKARC